MQKFPGQELNPCHSSDPSCCSDNARTLTYCVTRELLVCFYNPCCNFKERNVKSLTSYDLLLFQVLVFHAMEQLLQAAPLFISEHCLGDEKKKNNNEETTLSVLS